MVTYYGVSTIPKTVELLVDTLRKKEATAATRTQKYN